ncbi:MAG TPA: thiamine pyrophosphate-dependent enzyme [bacterium]|nr:thiamine pyrophosphate-dependent enzyme [bacterium]
MGTRFDMNENIDIAWCSGCGNFAIHKIIKESLEELDTDPQQVVFSSGIGQAGKMPQYINAHYFNGLHGRALPVATAIKTANPYLTVFAEGGDGDSYGEGGNHFIHTIRRNPDIVHLVHNNMIYGLTKGQGSPTTVKGQKTTFQPDGVYLEPFNPLAVAISLRASFVARVFSGDIDQAKEVFKRAVRHKGYALIDILHPCVSFNKVNTLKWFKENTYYIDEKHNPENAVEAFQKAMETEKLPLGIVYINNLETVLHQEYNAYKRSNEPLFKRAVDGNKLKKLLEKH